MPPNVRELQADPKALNAVRARTGRGPKVGARRHGMRSDGVPDTLGPQEYLCRHMQKQTSNCGT